MTSQEDAAIYVAAPLNSAIGQSRSHHDVSERVAHRWMRSHDMKIGNPQRAFPALSKLQFHERPGATAYRNLSPSRKEPPNIEGDVPDTFEANYLIGQC